MVASRKKISTRSLARHQTAGALATPSGRDIAGRRDHWEIDKPALPLGAPSSATANTLRSLDIPAA
jgi:hypothetical protein